MDEGPAEELVLAVSELVRALSPLPPDEKARLAEELVNLSRGTDLRPRFVSWTHHRHVVKYFMKMLRAVSQENIELRAEVEKLRELMLSAGVRPPRR